MHTCFIAVNFSIHTGGRGGQKSFHFYEGEAQNVCLQSGGGGKNEENRTMGILDISF